MACGSDVKSDAHTAAAGNSTAAAATKLLSAMALGDQRPQQQQVSFFNGVLVCQRGPVSVAVSWSTPLHLLQRQHLLHHHNL